MSLYASPFNQEYYIPPKRSYIALYPKTDRKPGARTNPVLSGQYPAKKKKKNKVMSVSLRINTEHVKQESEIHDIVMILNIKSLK